MTPITWCYCRIYESIFSYTYEEYLAKYQFNSIMHGFYKILDIGYTLTVHLFSPQQPAR